MKLRLRIIGQIALTAWAWNGIAQIAAKPLDLNVADFFQNQFYTVSVDNSLTCTDAEHGIFSLQQVRAAIAHYESRDPDARKKAVSFLLPKPLDSKLLNDCDEEPLCALGHLFSSQESAERALALFYDTRVAIKPSENRAQSFDLDQVRLIEKAIRKLPLHLRQKITRATFPDDGFVSDGFRPMSFEPLTESCFGGGECGGFVFPGSNEIEFRLNELDAAKSGKINPYDSGIKMIDDFRMHLVLHEIGHVVDFYAWRPEKQFALNVISLNSEFQKLIQQSQAALWPSRWWMYITIPGMIENGRYMVSIQEKFAEVFAQYILYPEGLREAAPEVYERLKDQVFNGIEYSGYGSCSHGVIELAPKY